MKCCLFKLVLMLVLGAVLNIAVAWACSITLDTSMSSTTSTRVYRFIAPIESHTYGMLWVFRYSRPGAIRIDRFLSSEKVSDTNKSTYQTMISFRRRPFPLQGCLFLALSKPFLAPNKSFLAPNKPFLAPSKPFLTPNKSFLALSKSFFAPGISLLASGMSLLALSKPFLA